MLQAAGADVALLASRLEVAQAELEGERAAHRREMRKKIREVQEVRDSRRKCSSNSWTVAADGFQAAMVL